MTTPATTIDPKASESTAPTSGAGATPGEGVKAADGKTPEATDTTEAPKTGADGKPAGDAAPAEFELKLPDGIKLDEALLGDFKPLAKELGLKSDGAQKLVDILVKSQQAAQEKAVADFEAQRKAWAESLRADKDFGGANFDANLGLAQKAFGKFGGEGLAKFLVETGLGDHPDIVRTFSAIGKAMAEDSIAGTAGRPTTPQPPSPEQKLRVAYPSMFAKE